MRILNSVKTAAIKTKLQGELMLIQRELETLHKQSGAELFTVLYDYEQQQMHAKLDSEQKQEQPLLDPNKVAAAAAAAAAAAVTETTSTTATIQLPVPGLTLVYQAAREDIMDLVEQRQLNVEEVDVVEVQMENIVPAVSAKNKAYNASTYLRHAAHLTKLKAEIVHLEREINIRKQIFGVQVFGEIDFLCNKNNDSLKEQLDGYNNQANNETHDGEAEDDEHYESLSPNAVKVAKPPPRRSDQDILALLQRIQQKMEPIVERQRVKQQEIAALVV
jgi:hypothetical protein